jgi:hypothetical protein
MPRKKLELNTKTTSLRYSTKSCDDLVGVCLEATRRRGCDTGADCPRVVVGEVELTAAPRVIENASRAINVEGECYPLQQELSWPTSRPMPANRLEILHLTSGRAPTRSCGSSGLLLHLSASCYCSFSSKSRATLFTSSSCTLVRFGLGLLSRSRPHPTHPRLSLIRTASSVVLEMAEQGRHAPRCRVTRLQCPNLPPVLALF